MELQYPDAFRCPISLDLMTDPVILTSGQTFDRPSIQRWLDSGHRTCPVTQLPLPPHPPLIPNHALRSLISHFTPTQNSNSHPDYQTLAAAAAAAPADPAVLSTALRIAKRDAAFRHLLSDSGAASHLLRLVADRHRPDLQDLALRLLLHLSLDGDDARVGLVAEGAVDRISGALRAPSPAAALAATLLTSLAVVDANKCTIGAHPAAIPGLAALLRQGSARDRREAATALYELCKFPDNRRRTVRCDSIPSLVQLAGTGSERAVEVLGLLAKCREGREQMRRVKNFMGVLGGVLRVGSSRGVEHALAVLCFVCADSGEVVSEARREGMLEMCLGFVDDGNEKIVRNALGLARVLEKWELGSFM